MKEVTQKDFEAFKKLYFGLRSRYVLIDQSLRTEDFNFNYQQNVSYINCFIKSHGEALFFRMSNDALDSALDDLCKMELNLNALTRSKEVILK
jgi:hypothetical protein